MAESQTESVFVKGVEITGASENCGVLMITSRITLSNGSTFDYESHNEVDFLDELQGIGGTNSYEAKQALGEDYLESIHYRLVASAQEKWGTLPNLLADVRPT